MADHPDDQDGRWLPLAAAADALGLPSGEALRGRIRRDRARYRTRRSNSGATLVWIASTDVRTDGEADARTPRPDAAGERPDASDRIRIAELEARLDERAAAIARLEREVSWLRGELERRRWPGLARWWRRVIYGE